MRRLLVRLMALFVFDKQKRKAFRKRYLYSPMERHLMGMEEKIDSLRKECAEWRGVQGFGLDFAGFRRNHGLVRAVQRVELDVFREVARVCRENGIQYWMSFGTLIGALRHQGFVPWDDDIDVCMMDDGFRKFAEIAPTALNPKICRLVALPNQIMRIYNVKFPPDENKLVDWMLLRMEKGSISPAVDIYPCYRCGAQTDEDSAFYLELQAKKRSIEDRLVDTSGYAEETPLLEAWRRRLVKPDGDHIIIGLEENSHQKRRPLRFSDVFPLRETMFEGEMHPIPRLAEYFLFRLYGDFTFPTNTHGHVELDSIGDEQLRRLMDYVPLSDRERT